MSQLKKYAPYIVLIIVLFLWFQSCENQKSTISDLKTEMSIDSLDFKLQEDKIAFQHKKIVSDRKTMEKLTSKVDGLRKINLQIKATVKTGITNVEALPVGDVVIKTDTFYIDDTKKIKHFLQLPQSYAMPKDDWVKIKYSIDTLGLSVIDTAYFISKPIISLGYKDEGPIKNIFKKNIPVVTYQDENPYSNIQGLQNLEFKPKVKWYERKIVYIGVGLVGGILIFK